MDDEGDADGVATKTSKKPKKVEKEKRCLAITKGQRAKEQAKTNARIEKINEKHKSRVADLRRELKDFKIKLMGVLAVPWRGHALESTASETSCRLLFGIAMAERATPPSLLGTQPDASSRGRPFIVEPLRPSLPPESHRRPPEEPRKGGGRPSPGPSPVRRRSAPGCASGCASGYAF